MHGPAEMSRWRRSAELIGRRAECAVLDQLIGVVRAGESRALVVHGEPGVGKTALLDYVGVQALGCRVVRGSGVQSEMELPFAGLHQLCAPLLDRLDRLPEPQREALRTAFGMSVGATPDRFLVGLAVLGLLADAAEERPLMCLVDDHQWEALSARHVRLARELGSLSELPLALTTRAYMLLFAGDLGGAAALADEAQVIGDATGATLAPYGALGVAAFRGDAAAVAGLYEAALLDINRRGEGVGITFAEWANALLCNGLGRYDDALAAARRGTEYSPDPGSLIFAAVELVEAAARTEQPREAAEIFECFAAMTAASGTDWALGLHARSQALLTGGDTADGLYRDAIAHLGRTRLRAELARAHLLYGEWLRRMRRHNAAREQLRTAHTMLEAMGMAAFAERANRELRAAGGAVRKRTDASRYDELTAQETQIARMARDGLSNPEIASRLFISAHTVQYHLRKVFTKLGVTSRSQLDRALPDSRGA